MSKNRLFSVLALSAIVSIAACAKSEPAVEENAAPATETTAPEGEMAPATEAAPSTDTTTPMEHTDSTGATATDSAAM